MIDIGFRTPFPVVFDTELNKPLMRVPREMEAQQVGRPWEPIPGDKIITIIGDKPVLVPGLVNIDTSNSLPSYDDGMVGIAGIADIRAFCEWWYGSMT